MASQGVTAFVSLLVGLLVGFACGYSWRLRQNRKKERYEKCIQALKTTKASSGGSQFAGIATQYSQQALSYQASKVSVGQPQKAASYIVKEQSKPSVEQVEQQSTQQEQKPKPTSAGHRSQLSTIVDESYDLEDLDEEWKAILSEVDSQLSEQGMPGLCPQERSIAIKSLLVSEPGADRQQAFDQAIRDIEQYRVLSQAES